MDTKVKQYNKQLDQIYKPQAQQLRKQYEATLPQFKAQEESLRQAKVNAFRDIGNTANQRGMFFSGFQPAEQARYVGTEFLPALAEVEGQRRQGKLDLMSALTGLQTDRRSRVMDFRETLRQEAQERKRLQEQRAWEERQAQLDRQNRLQTSGGGGSTPTTLDVDANIRAMLNAAKGSDGKVSPTDWRQIAGYADQRGISFGGGEGFANRYWDYVNEDHWEDYKQGYDKYL